MRGIPRNGAATIGAAISLLLSCMRYHVSSSNGLKNSEFDIYIDVLRQLGHSTDREMTREPLPSGAVYLKGGRIGVVETLPEAEAIKASLLAKLPYLSWDIDQIP